jgi:uncharacterized protein (TIRG00374 family)
MKWIQRVTLALGVLLLAGLIWKLGPLALLSQLALLSWTWIPLILIEGAGEALHVTGWRHCLSPAHRRIPWLRIAMIRQAGMAYNYLTPTAHLGGEVVKGTLLGSDGEVIQAATGVIVGKLALVLGQLLFVTVGSTAALWMVALPIQLWVAWALSTALFTAGIGAFFLLQRQGKLGSLARALDRSGARGLRLGGIARWLTLVDDELRAFYRDRPRDLLRAVAWHVMGFSCGLVQSWIFFHRMGLNDPWAMGFAVWFLGAWFDLVGFIVPAGVGVQEGSRVLIFHAAGLSSIAGLTFGFVLRINKAFWALVGLACHGLLLRQSKTRGVRWDKA